MDMFLKESIEEMMYEEDRFWNMEEITDWNDDIKIEINSSEYEAHMEQEDEIEQEAMMLTNVECEDLKRFMVQKAAEKPQVFCKSCSKRTNYGTM